MSAANEQFMFQEEEEEAINLKEVAFKYIIHWKWFVLSLLLALAFAYTYLRYQTALYEIKSSILVKDEKKGMGQDDMLKQLDIFSSSKVVDNEIEILKSYTLMEKVVQDLDLNIIYFKKGRVHDVELYEKSPVKVKLIKPGEFTTKEPLELEITGTNTIQLNGVDVPLNKVTATPYGIMQITLTGISPEMKEVKLVITPVNEMAEGILKELEVEASSKMSSVLNMTMKNSIPQKGKDILNDLISAYSQAALDDKNKVAANTLVFIEERLKLISGELTTVEKNVEDYKSKEGITDISVESQLFLQSVKDNDIQLNLVKVQQSILGGIEEYVKNKENKPGTVPATLGVSDPTLLSLIQGLSEMEMQREKQVRLVKADNPLVLAMDDQIKSLKSKIYENVQSLKQNLNLSALQLESQNLRLEGMIKTIPGKERALVDISREQAIKNALFTYLLQKREETALSFASAVSDIRIVDAARASTSPVTPRRSIYILFSLLGLAIPFATIYILDVLNDKIKRRKDIEKATQTPILGEICWTEHNKVLVIDNESRSAFAEQIRGLRTNLSFLSIGKDVQAILFTSSMSGEGKSFISLNLGASLAMTGKKTIILEFDMRKPKLGAALSLKVEKGLSNYLIGRAELDEIIVPVPNQENFYIIPCGNVPPNPVELLVNGRLEGLISELRKRFDHIIIDAPPIGLVTDAQILEKQVDATLFVLRHDFTSLDKLKIVDALYRDAKFKNLNLIFNGIKTTGKYGYGYGYGYGYYHSNETKGLKRKNEEA